MGNISIPDWETLIKNKIKIKVYRFDCQDYLDNKGNPTPADWIVLENIELAPVMLCVDQTTKWLKEKIEIKEGYPAFSAWVANQSDPFWGSDKSIVSDNLIQTVTDVYKNTGGTPVLQSSAVTGGTSTDNTDGDNTGSDDTEEETPDTDNTDGGNTGSDDTEEETPDTDNTDGDSNGSDNNNVEQPILKSSSVLTISEMEKTTENGQEFIQLDHTLFECDAYVIIKAIPRLGEAMEGYIPLYNPQISVADNYIALSPTNEGTYTLQIDSTTTPSLTALRNNGLKLRGDFTAGNINSIVIELYSKE